MNKEKYTEIIHSRLNHVQNLQSAISGLVITASGWLIAKTNLTSIPFIQNEVIIYCVYGLLIWMHLFTLYQYFCVKKAAFILSNLENQVTDYTGIKYFDMDNMRLYLYFLSHGAPSIIAFVAPYIGYTLGAIAPWLALKLFVFYIVFTFLTIWLLGFSFRYNNKTW
jgi:hypothetical protein